MKKMDIYESVRSVPAHAQKQIMGGRMKGMTDINPMWRIKTLTEQFGACGLGWKTVLKRFWLEKGANDEIAAFCEIELFIKIDGEWSEGITGIGGSMFVSNEKNGAYTSDECYKMAHTDAIGVACKALGVGADVYWGNDKSKYSDKSNKVREERLASLQPFMQTEQGKKQTAEIIAEIGNGKKLEEISESDFNKILEKIKEGEKHE